MSESPPPHTLLARALASLSEDEQGEVLKSLLHGPSFSGHRAGLTSAPTAAMAGIALGREVDVVAAYALQNLRPSSGEQTSLLVRLPAPLHAQLKEWSESHGHSMNTVVRGLLERFLATQSGSGSPG